MINTKLKPGQEIKAVTFDNQISKIISIENNIVKYKCYAYENKQREDGYFHDTIETVKKHFDLIKTTK